MRKFSGVSLIEVLISFLILSAMLLGLDALQVTALRETKNAYYFSVAAQQLNNMVERFATFGDKQLDEQLAGWNQQNQAVLPQGRGRLEWGPHTVLTIYWGRADQQRCDKNKTGMAGCLHILL